MCRSNWKVPAVSLSVSCCRHLLCSWPGWASAGILSVLSLSLPLRSSSCSPELCTSLLPSSEPPLSSAEFPHTPLKKQNIVIVKDQQNQQQPILCSYVCASYTENQQHFAKEWYLCVPMVLRRFSSSSCCLWKELCWSLVSRSWASSVFRSNCCFSWRYLK